MRKAVVALLAGLVLSACGASVRQQSQTDWHSAKSGIGGKKATIVIGSDIEFSARILSAADGMLNIDQNGEKASLPEEVVTRIRMSGSSAKTNMLIGGSIGAVVGTAGGYLLGSAAGDESGARAVFHPLSMVVILGSTVGGVFIGSNLTQASEYVLSNRPIPVVLSPETGSEIGGMAISAFGLFDNLVSSVDEKLIQVTIYSLSSGRYLLVYDVSVGGSFQVRWKAVDENYIATQRAKINVQG